MNRDEWPPVWLVALFVGQVLVGLGLLYLGVAITGPGIRAADVLIFSIPLVFMTGTSGVSWWLWIEGWRASAWVVAALPLVLVFALVFLIGVGL